MSRELKSQTLKTRIVESAKALFLEQGYAQTTIRQISATTGLSTGSIYHFFQNKDDIFRLLIEEVVNGSVDAANHLSRAGDPPALVLGLEMALIVRLFSADRHIASLFAAAHRAWTLRQFIIERGMARNQSLFAPLRPQWEDRQFYEATLTIAGIVAVLVDEHQHANRLSDAQRRAVLIRGALAAFEFPQVDIEAVLTQVEQRLTQTRG